MNVLHTLFFDDLKKFTYLMNSEEKRKYPHYKLVYAGLGLLFSFSLAYVSLGFGASMLLCMLLFTLLASKIPFLLLCLRHKQKSNAIVDAIPIWINTLYSMIGENNIYNSIVLSYDTAPKALQYDLQRLITRIQHNNDDKDAYINFLSAYAIDGFRDIMMKLYEFRNLSKDKLKYEFSHLNDALASIEKMKRERRFKKEMFTVDTSTLLLMTIPCMYLFFVSLLLSETMM